MQQFLEYILIHLDILLMKKDIVVLARRPTQVLEHTLTGENIY